MKSAPLILFFDFERILKENFPNRTHFRVEKSGLNPRGLEKGPKEENKRSRGGKKRDPEGEKEKKKPSGLSRIERKRSRGGTERRNPSGLSWYQKEKGNPEGESCPGEKKMEIIPRGKLF